MLVIILAAVESSTNPPLVLNNTAQVHGWYLGFFISTDPCFYPL
ncbi:hypothetical protein GHNINEIG_00758 [Hydrogenovibrio crunogenus]|uniref:Uncharacterized protein n=1 Tax=Hydrogenovibrio crunogenus TaxID=39765 RepID=A0A4P7NY78_9GAMM|nr:hypothetical protein GHNINEIG_00758 [Hydrogenovibrio crunogenus]